MKRNEYLDNFTKRLLKRKILNVIIPMLVILAITSIALGITNKVLVTDDIDLNDQSNETQTSNIDNENINKDNDKENVTNDKNVNKGEKKEEIKEDEGENNIENNDDISLVGNGDGVNEGIDIFDWQDRISNDVLYDRPFSMYSTDYVNVRLMPVISDNIIDMKKPGERVEVIGESQDGIWFRIKYGDWYAYVIKEYFSTSKIESTT